MGRLARSTSDWILEDAASVGAPAEFAKFIAVQQQRSKAVIAGAEVKPD